MEQASQHPPGLDRDADQQGDQHQKQQGLGHRGEAREDAARRGTGSLGTHWLARTAATKRGYEDDSENGKKEIMIAPKKAREDIENYLGGGGKRPLKNEKLEKN